MSFPNMNTTGLASPPQDSPSPSLSPGPNSITVTVGSGSNKRKQVVEMPLPPGSLTPRKRARTQDEKEQRRIERIMRNRQAAHASREKKRKYMENLENRCENLTKENKSLQDQLNETKLKQTELVNQHHTMMDQIKQLTSIIQQTTGLKIPSLEFKNPKDKSLQFDSPASISFSTDEDQKSTHVSSIPEEEQVINEMETTSTSNFESNPSRYPAVIMQKTFPLRRLLLQMKISFLINYIMTCCLMTQVMPILAMKIYQQYCLHQMKISKTSALNPSTQKKLKNLNQLQNMKYHLTLKNQSSLTAHIQLTNGFIQRTKLYLKILKMKTTSG